LPPAPLPTIGGMHPVYTIDARDRIVAVNGEWLRFARPQGSVDAALSDVIGRSIWEVTPGGQVRQLWQVLYQRVRSVGAQVLVPMRVDTARERRLIEIELRPLADQSIQHICERVWSESRPFAALLDPSSNRDQRQLHACAWCSRIQVSVGVWQELEDALATLAIDTEGPLPMLASVACITCKQSLLKTFPLF
jgi:hypothetical protein